MSVIFGVIGPFVEVVYTLDWWAPLTITGTVVGIEDVLFGFVCGGIATVVYEEIFKKRIKIRKVSKIRRKQENLNLFVILGLTAFLFLVPFYLLNLNSFQSTIICLAIPTLIIWAKRRDLIVDSLATGIILVLVTSIVYTLLNFLTPGWISAFWYFRNVPHILLLNIPLDDFVWYFLIGAFVGPLYEYWREGRLINKQRLKQL